MIVQFPRRAMVIWAHPDDLEYFVGGTVALWATAGVEVTYVLVTSGDKGLDDLRVSPAEVAAIREREQRGANAVLGIQNVVFLGEPDGELTPTLELRLRLVCEIRRYRPDAVMLPDPTRYFFEGFVNHPDHRAAGEAALAAVAPAAANPRYHPELLAQGLAPHRVSELWLATSPQPNRWVDISGVFEAKVAAMRCHESQIHDPHGLEAHMAAHTLHTGALGETGHREGFRYLKLA